MRNAVRVLVLLAVVHAASGSTAGTIVSTIGGASFLSVGGPGVLVTIDTVVTFGPTEMLAGSTKFIEISFDYSGAVVGGGGVTVAPLGWLDLAGGSFSCVAGHCENIIAALDLPGFGQSFPAGSTFALPSITIDTAGLAPGIYSVGAGFTGPGPDTIAIGGVDVSSEYTTVGAAFLVGPEPGTALLLTSGLLALGVARRRRS